jgi:hypothetical protein
LGLSPASWVGPLASRDQEDKEFGFDVLGFKTQERPRAMLNSPSDFNSEKYIIFLRAVPEIGSYRGRVVFRREPRIMGLALDLCR